MPCAGSLYAGFNRIRVFEHRRIAICSCIHAVNTITSLQLTSTKVDVRLDVPRLPDHRPAVAEKLFRTLVQQRWVFEKILTQ